MSYETIWEEKGIYWKYKGILTGDDLLQSNVAIYGDARFDKLRYQLIDMLDVETFDVDTEAHGGGHSHGCSSFTNQPQTRSCGGGNP